MEYVVEINDLVKDYETGFFKKKKVRAVDGISLSVKGGQIFGFLGGNGAGKTTTIKMLMSLLYPTAGSAKILGRDISDFTMHSRIGYCPENPYFYDYLTPRELLTYFGDLFGVDKTKTKDRAEDLLDQVGLDPKDRTKQLRKFSKGMLQRVGLAQSLINDPEIVFLDEPMSGLDPIGRREVRELIAGLREKGTTVFMSTHILSDVEALCDEVAILRSGRVAACGDLYRLLERTEERRAFEVIVSGVDAATLRSSLSVIDTIEVAEKHDGAAITVPDEGLISEVVSASRQLNGNLVSILPARRSLEELFVNDPLNVE